MKNQPSYFTGCIDAVESLRSDLKQGHITLYGVESIPSGILPPPLASKCSSAMIGLSSDGESEYLAIIPQRIDKQKSSDTKEIDSDPIIFAKKAGNPEFFPTGIFVHHASYDGRTQPISGFDHYSCEDTIRILKSKLVTGIEPLSSTDSNYLNAFSHGIEQFATKLGSAFKDWKPEVYINREDDLKNDGSLENTE